MRLHTIELDPLGLDGEWVKIPERRSFDARISVDEALLQGNRAFNLARARWYFSEWSFPEDLTEARILVTDDDIISYVLAQAEAHYERVRRTPAERKSDAGAAGEGGGAARSLAGYGPRDGGDTAAADPISSCAVSEPVAAGSARVA